MRSSRASPGAPATTRERIVGVPELVYVGNHGLELDAERGRVGRPAAAFLAETWTGPRPRTSGLTASLHYRGATDEDAARATLERRRSARGDRASSRASGARCSRCCRRSTRTRAPQCGSCSPSASLGARSTPATTRPTSTASAALDGLDLSVRIAVVSAEGPAELREAADLTLAGPREVLGPPAAALARATRSSVSASNSSSLSRGTGELRSCAGARAWSSTGSLA